MNRYIAELVIVDEEDDSIIAFEISSPFVAENDKAAIEKLTGDPQCRVKRLYKEVDKREE